MGREKMGKAAYFCRGLGWGPTCQTPMLALAGEEDCVAASPLQRSRVYLRPLWASSSPRAESNYHIQKELSSCFQAKD